jgi:hypothetical protein
MDTISIASDIRWVDIGTLIVLAITLAVVVKYAIDTNRIARSTEEAHLRPVILRSGFLASWDELTPWNGVDPKLRGASFSFVEFTILRHIATQISGHAIVNGFRFPLYFGNDISQRGPQFFLNRSWAWMKADTKLFAMIRQEDAIADNLPNEIRIHYSDITGTPYVSLETADFQQKSFKA